MIGRLGKSTSRYDFFGQLFLSFQTTPKMPIFIDESGDTGSIYRSGSKHFFRLGAVWSPSLDVAAKFKSDLRELKTKCGFHDEHEFKFTKAHSKNNASDQFFDLALRYPFHFFACGIDKRKETWKGLQKKDIFERMINALAQEMTDTLAFISPQTKTEHIFLDRSDDPAFKAQVELSFRELKQRTIHLNHIHLKCKWGDSKREEMLQLADMIVGLAGAKWDGENPSWFSKVQSKMKGTRNLPENQDWCTHLP